MTFEEFFEAYWQANPSIEVRGDFIRNRNLPRKRDCPLCTVKVAKSNRLSKVVLNPVYILVVNSADCSPDFSNSSDIFYRACLLGVL